MVRLAKFRLTARSEHAVNDHESMRAAPASTIVRGGGG